MATKALACGTAVFGLLTAAVAAPAAGSASPAWTFGGPAAHPMVFAPGVISTGDDDAHITFDPDGRHVYFLKDAPDFSFWAIAVVEWDGSAWGAPRIAPFSGRWGDGDLSFAPDGKTAYFVSTRPVAAAQPARDDTEIWRLRRKSGGPWGEPEHVAELSSPGSEWFPNMTADGWLYFGSERPEGNKGRPGTSDLWRAKLDGDRFGPPENLGAVVNSIGQDIEPWVSADGSMMIFASNARQGGRGIYDLYVTHRCGETWSEPRNLGDEVNTPGWEFGPRMSPDGRSLFFTSSRGFTAQPLEKALSYEELVRKIREPGNGLRDVYRVDTSALDLSSNCPSS